MKKYFLFFSLFSVLFFVWSPTAKAKKRYRYIKRTHGVHFAWDVPMNYSQQQFKASTDLSAAYTYNWRGMLEFGPYFDFAAELKPFQTHKVAGGVLLEYNIIKNRGKRKFIPAIGISLGGQSGGASTGGGFDNYGTSEFKASGGVHGALKIFVDKRTPFTIMLGYKLLTPTSPFFQSLSHDIVFATGFSYYFDFY